MIYKKYTSNLKKIDYEFNILILETDIELIRRLSSYKIPYISPVVLEEGFRSRYKNHIRDLAFYLNISQRKGCSLFWDLLLNRKVLVQLLLLLLFPERNLRPIKNNFATFLFNTFPEKELIISSPYIYHKWEYVGSFSFLIIYKYINLKQFISVYSSLDIFNIRMFLNYLQNYYLSCYASLTNLKKVYYKPFIVITFDHKYCVEVIIKPVKLNNSLKAQCWLLEKTAFTFLDIPTFCSFIYKILEINRNYINSMNIIFYLIGEDDKNKEIKMPAYSFTKVTKTKNFSRETYIKFLYKMLCQINIEEYYLNISEIIIYIIINGKESINLPVYSTITFPFFDPIFDNEEEDIEDYYLS